MITRQKLTVLWAIPWLMIECVSSENEDSRRASEDSRRTAFKPSTDAFVKAVFNARLLPEKKDVKSEDVGFGGA